MFGKTIKRILCFTLILTFGCSSDHFDPNITTGQKTFIMTHVFEHPAMKQFPYSELGSSYDDGSSWRVQIRKRGQKSPSVWFRVDKESGKVTLID